MITYREATAVIPSDTVALAKPCQALYIGAGGTVIVQMAYDNPTNATTTFSGVQPGTILPIVASYVMVASSAGGIVALNF